jgi:hypothetical protein
MSQELILKNAVLNEIHIATLTREFISLHWVNFHIYLFTFHRVFT